MADKRRRAEDEDDDDVGLRTPTKKPTTRSTARPEKAREEPAPERPKAKGDTGRRGRPEAAPAEAPAKAEAPRKTDTGKRKAVAEPAAPGGKGKGVVLAAAGLVVVLALGGVVALLMASPPAPAPIAVRPGPTPATTATPAVGPATPTPTPGPAVPRPGPTMLPPPAATTEAAAPQPATATGPPVDPLTELARRSANHAAVARFLEQYNEVFKFDSLSGDPNLVEFQAREARERELLEQLRALGPAAVPALLEMLTGLDQRAHQVFLAKALAGMDAPEALRAVEQALGSMKDVAVQTTLVRFLPETADAAAIVGRAVGGEPNPNLRGMLLREYSRRVGEGDDAGRELFRRVAVEDQDPNVRAEAITLIGRRGDQRDAELLERICQNEEQLPIRQRAIVSYAETGKDRSLPYLEGLARDTAQALPIRASAVLAIGRVGGDQALRALDTLAQTDPDQEIRTRAQRLAASLRTRAQAERDTPIDTDPVRVIPGAPGVNNVDKMR